MRDDSRLREIGERVLNLSGCSSRDEQTVRVGLLMTQLATERKKSREAQALLEEERRENENLTNQSLRLENCLRKSEEMIKNPPHLPQLMKQQQRSLLAPLQHPFNPHLTQLSEKL